MLLMILYIKEIKLERPPIRGEGIGAFTEYDKKHCL